MLKKLLISIWITGWSIIAAYEISTTLELINISSNKETWPPEGFVIVENRSGDKIMISEETDQKFNPKNPDICDENFITTIKTEIINDTLFISYLNDPIFYGVKDLELKIIPSGDHFRPDRGFKIHNFRKISLTNESSHEIPLNIYETVQNEYYIDFILQGFSEKNNELCFTELLLSINEENFTNYKTNTPFFLEEVLQPAFEENPNISVIGENEYIKNVIENNQKKLLFSSLPTVSESALVLLNQSTRYSNDEEKDIWVNTPRYYPSVRDEIVIGLFGEVINYDFIALSNILETLKIVAPNLKITISNDVNDVTLPIHLSPCNELISDKFNNCFGYAAGIYYGWHDFIWVDSSITNKNRRAHVIIHELGHALGLNHNLCIDSVMSYSQFADETSYFNHLDLMQLSLLYHPEVESYDGKSFKTWVINKFQLDENIVEKYENDPYLACNANDENEWKELIRMQK